LFACASDWRERPCEPKRDGVRPVADGLRHSQAELSTPAAVHRFGDPQRRRRLMNGIIYLVGLIVVVLAILSFAGLR
jgi:hypothetical protein